MINVLKAYFLLYSKLLKKRLQNDSVDMNFMIY